ncbi:MAG: hypothetical protein U0L58_04130 [Ruminococcus sp.]|nr:hypothetical protein [Ruminococcus sp.]MEE0856468.1 hypothetical protein [Ruminococcus sp.]
MDNYDDIINLERPKNTTRKPMSAHDRAAQFAPFAALTGYDSAINETARLTDSKIELSEEELRELGEKIVFLAQHSHDKPLADFVYFVPDLRKEGGSYVTATGNVRKIDDFERVVIFTDGRRINLDDIFSIIIHI